jgi:hypothetical protein
VKEFFFDDDTFTDNLPRAEAIARELGKLGDLVVQRQGQRAAQDAEGDEGQRPAPAAGRLRIRQPADPAQHQEGHARSRSPRFTKDCHELGIKIHGTFILGLPGETQETIQETIASPRRSTRTPSRCRWPRPIPAPPLQAGGRERLAARDADLV